MGGVKGTLPSSHEERAVTVENELSQADLEQVVGGKALFPYLAAAYPYAVGGAVLGLASQDPRVRGRLSRDANQGRSNTPRLTFADGPKKKR
jgi:hypothetical protein